MWVNATRTASTGTDRGRASSTLTVAVTGTSGTIGPALLHRLGESSKVSRVIAIGRRPTADMDANPKVEFRVADVREAGAVEEAVAGADVVVHMAFSLYGVIADEATLFDTNVRGTANVAGAAVRTGARRFVYTSSAAVYGGSERPQPLSENAPIRAPSRLFYARHKAQAELVVGERLADSLTEAFVFRPCAIVGPHAAGVLARRLPDGLRRGMQTLARATAALGLRPALPPPAVPLQFVHEDDVAQALAIAIHGDSAGGVYNLAGDGALSGAQTLQVLGIRALPVPRFAVNLSLDALAKVPPLVPASGWPELIHAPIMLDTRRAHRELGWRPRFSSEQALHATRMAIGW